MDGVLLSSIGLSPRALAGIRSNVPIVLLGERTTKSALDHVGIDNVAYDVVTHLVQIGRTRIAALGGSGTPLDAAPHATRPEHRLAQTRSGGAPRPAGRRA